MSGYSFRKRARGATAAPYTLYSDYTPGHVPFTVPVAVSSGPYRLPVDQASVVFTHSCPGVYHVGAALSGERDGVASDSPGELRPNSTTAGTLDR